MDDQRTIRAPLYMPSHVGCGTQHYFRGGTKELTVGGCRASSGSAPGIILDHANIVTIHELGQDGFHE